MRTNATAHFPYGVGTGESVSDGCVGRCVRVVEPLGVRAGPGLVRATFGEAPRETADTDDEEGEGGDHSQDDAD